MHARSLAHLLARSRARGLACSLARGRAGPLAGSLARGFARLHARGLGPAPYNTKKIHRLGPPSPFFSIINKSQGGPDMIRGYTVYVRFGALGVGLGVGLGWFGLVWRFRVFIHCFCIWHLESLHESTIRLLWKGLVWGWFGVGLAWFGVGFAYVSDEKQAL